jgi:hypothetical protein
MRLRLGRFAVGAVLVLALAASATARSARADDAPISEEARMHFSAGVALLQDPKAPRYEEAYREFKAAYAASSSYKILGNLGLSAMKIERDAEAINAYETYLREAGPEVTAQEREQIQRDLLTLRAGIVNVTISSEPAGATIVDVRTPIEGADVRNAYGEALAPLNLALRHGHHVITARMAGFQDQQWEFDASGTALPPHVFTLTRPVSADRPVRERPTPVSAYVAGGVTLTLAVTGAVFGLTALQKHNDFNALNDGEHVSAADSAKTNGQTLNVITDALFGAAIVGAVVTTYIVLSRPSVVREREASEPAPRAASFVPRVAPSWSPEHGEHGRGGRGGRGGVIAAWTF